MTKAKAIEMLKVLSQEGLMEIEIKVWRGQGYDRIDLDPRLVSGAVGLALNALLRQGD
jgi:hypothetical protein